MMMDYNDVLRFLELNGQVLGRYGRKCWYIVATPDGKVQARVGRRFVRQADNVQEAVNILKDCGIRFA